MKQNFLAYKDQLNRFANVSEEDWNTLLPYFKEESFNKDEYYLKEGQICKTVSFVFEGAFKSYYERKGEMIINDFYCKNEFVVEVASFVKQMPSDSFIIAEKNTQVISISYSDLEYFCDSSASGSRLVRKMYDYFYILRSEQEILLRLLDAQTRLKSFIESAPQIFENFNQKDIASYLKMSRETLSRLKNKI